MTDKTRAKQTAMMAELIEAVKPRGWVTYDEASEVIAKIGADRKSVV